MLIFIRHFRITTAYRSNISRIVCTLFEYCPWRFELFKLSMYYQCLKISVEKITSSRSRSLSEEETKSFSVPDLKKWNYTVFLSSIVLKWSLIFSWVVFPAVNGVTPIRPPRLTWHFVNIINIIVYRFNFLALYVWTTLFILIVLYNAGRHSIPDQYLNNNHQKLNHLSSYISKKILYKSVLLVLKIIIKSFVLENKWTSSLHMKEELRFRSVPEDWTK